MVGDGGSVNRDVWLLWVEGTILGDAADVPDRHGSSGVHCVDQFNRQSRWLLRPVVRRRDQGLVRQLRWWPLRISFPVCDVGSGLRLLLAHPKSDASGANGNRA